MALVKFKDSSLWSLLALTTGWGWLWPPLTSSSGVEAVVFLDSYRPKGENRSSKYKQRATTWTETKTSTHKVDLKGCRNETSCEALGCWKIEVVQCYIYEFKSLFPNLEVKASLMKKLSWLRWQFLSTLVGIGKKMTVKENNFFLCYVFNINFRTTKTFKNSEYFHVRVKKMSTNYSTYPFL